VNRQEEVDKHDRLPFWASQSGQGQPQVRGLPRGRLARPW